MNKLFLILLTNALIFNYNSIAQNFEWAKRIGNTQAETSSVSCLDKFGNIYMTGTFKNTVDFDPGATIFNLSSNNNSFDVFIIKLAPNGSFLWAKSLGGSAVDNVKHIACDSAGSVFVSGTFQGSINLNTDSGGTQMVTTVGGYQSDYDIFIVKLNALGQFIFGFALGSSAIDSAPLIKIDKSENLVIAGFLPGGADLDPSSNSYNLWANYGISFIAKYTNAGNFLWAKNFGTEPIPYPYGSTLKNLFIDFDNNIHITGEFTNYADLNPDTSIVLNLIAEGNSDIYLLKLDENGIFINVKQLGGPGNTYSSGNELSEGATFFDTDDNSNIYITGYFIDDTDFDFSNSNFILNSSQGNQFIVKYDSAYNLIWVKQLLVTFNGQNGIATDLHQNVYLTGTFDGTVDFNPGLGVNSLQTNSPRVFLLKLDSLGNFVWANKLQYATKSFAIEADNLGNIINSGTFGGVLGDFDPTSSIFNLQSAGADDYYILKWSEDSCANIAIVFDSINHVSCLNNGFISAHIVNGFPPYQYYYNNAIISDSTFTTNQSGIYELNVQDSYGCETSTSFIMQGPTTNTGVDLGVNLVFQSFQSGFQSLLHIDAFNDGCTASNGQLKMILDTALNFITSTPLPDTINGDTLMWNFLNLDYQSPHIIIPITVGVSQFLLINNPVAIHLEITPINGDLFPNNNIRNYDALSVGAYDPNDKQVYPKGSCTPGFVLQQSLLTYTIRFQNTGNAPAHDVVIIDSLFNDFDLSSFRIVGQSHQVVTEVLPNKVLKFNFNNIMLPDSTSDELNSNGFVIFEIKPTLLPNGTIIKNKTYIYFDFNEPIITNTVQNKVVNIIPTFTPTVTSNANQLYATTGFAPFDWVNCNNTANSLGINTAIYAFPPDGVYAVYANSNEGCRGMSNCINFALGVDEIVQNKGIELTPNPVQNSLNIKVEGQMHLKIIDILGKKIGQFEVKNYLIIDTSPLDNGLYFVVDEKGNAMKFIKD
jgi:hypothetical protein